MHTVVRSRFYTHATLALAMFVIAAFLKTLLPAFPRRPAPAETPAAHTRSGVHGMAAAFVAQVRLIAAHRVDLHRKFGLAGVLLAAVVFVVGVVTALQTAAEPVCGPRGVPSAVPHHSTDQHHAVRLAGWREHRATPPGVLAQTADAAGDDRGAWARGHPFRELAGPATAWPPAPVVVATVFVGWCLLADWRRYRVVHPLFLVGGLVLILSSAVSRIAAVNADCGSRSESGWWAWSRKRRGGSRNSGSLPRPCIHRPGRGRPPSASPYRHPRPMSGIRGR